MSQNSLNIVGKHDVNNVKNIEEFNDYYKLHEEEINKLSIRCFIWISFSYFEIEFLIS